MIIGGARQAGQTNLPSTRARAGPLHAGAADADRKAQRAIAAEHVIKMPLVGLHDDGVGRIAFEADHPSRGRRPASATATKTKASTNTTKICGPPQYQRHINIPDIG